jgi:hypothetical protein
VDRRKPIFFANASRIRLESSISLPQDSAPRWKRLGTCPLELGELGTCRRRRCLFLWTTQASPRNVSGCIRPGFSMLYNLLRCSNTIYVIFHLLHPHLLVLSI